MAKNEKKNSKDSDSFLILGIVFIALGISLGAMNSSDGKQIFAGIPFLTVGVTFLIIRLTRKHTDIDV